MKKILFFVLLLISVTSFSQVKKTLVRDELWFSSSASGACKVVTSNFIWFDKLYTKFSYKCKELKQLKKKDRRGYYIEYTFAFDKEYHNEVVTYLNNLPK